MNGDEPTPAEGERPAVSNTNDLRPYADLDGEERRAAIAERLRDLAGAIEGSLLDLADDVESGDDVESETVLDVRELLAEADTTTRRHLDGVDRRDYSTVIRDPREGSNSTDLSDVHDLDHLATEAEAGDVADALIDDVEELRVAAERVEKALYLGDLTDVLATDLWDAGAAVETWGREVLTARTDRRHLLTREEAEALDRAEEKLGEDGHA
jgi:hypothetical protein